jgi:hypothetical protein
MNHQHTFNVGDRVRVPLGGQSGIVSAWGYDRVWLEDGRCFHQEDVAHVEKPHVQPDSSNPQEDFKTIMAAVAEWVKYDYACYPTPSSKFARSELFYAYRALEGL